MTIETYLARLARALSVAPSTRDQILQEVRDHLEDAARQGTHAGLARADAEAQATAAFGEPATVAARFNAVHPLHWDWRRFGVGTVWGIAAAWALWTLLTYPLLVQLATQGQTRLSADTLSPWALLFYASPLAFGLFNVLATAWYWFVPLFLVLYGLTPFWWARRAGSGWRPGLAFGLGVLFGFPWLLPALVVRWDQGNPLAILLAVMGIWLLAPVAVIAGALGQRSLKWRPATRGPRRLDGPAAPRGPFRLTAAVALTGCLGLALLGVNVWSVVHAAELRPATLPPLSQQISAAQAMLPFTLRQPSDVPPGMAFVSVTATPGACRAPCADLSYDGPRGTWLSLLEIVNTPSALFPQATSTYQVSQMTVVGVSPTWWFGNDVTTEQQISITWAKDGIAYVLGTDAPLSVSDLERVAGSIE